jgi:hypothetical protein
MVIKASAQSNLVYTTPEAATVCVELTRHYAPDDALWIDAACGASKVFHKNFPAGVWSTTVDIDPAAQATHTMSFLDYHPPESIGPCVVCSNLPFGNATKNLALKMINHAAEFADTIGVIVGASTIRQAWIGKVHPNLRLVAVRRVPNNAFTRSVACSAVFMVFVREAKPVAQTARALWNEKPPSGVQYMCGRKDSDDAPNLGVVKLGTVFKLVTGTDLQKRWQAAIRDRRTPGQSTAYFLKVDNQHLPAITKRINELEKGGGLGLYKSWCTVAANVSRADMSYWLQTEGPMTDFIPSLHVSRTSLMRTSDRRLVAHC